MPKLQCDICGGSIVMQGGGQLAVCDSCGMQYSIERMREKVQEITGTVRIEGPVQARQTGTEDDVAQWKSLLNKYYKAGDFQAAENIVRKILEAVPSDEQANKMYDELQVLKFVEIKNGVLISFNGQAKSLAIPNCVEKIEDDAFKGNKSLIEVTIPFGVEEIGRSAFEDCVMLESISIPDSVQKIGDKAFCGCRLLTNIELSKNLICIGNWTFSGCTALKRIFLPDTLTTIGDFAFKGCILLESINIPNSVKKSQENNLNGTFENCPALKEVNISEQQLNELFTWEFDGVSYIHRYIFETSKNGSDGKNYYLDTSCGSWYLNLKHITMKNILEAANKQFADREADWKKHGCCRYCGGKFTGIFTQKCSQCGRPKDY